MNEEAKMQRPKQRAMPQISHATQAVLLVATMMLAVGCSDAPQQNNSGDMSAAGEDMNAPDSGVVAMDMGEFADAGLDAGHDAGSDKDLDAGLDSGRDAGGDAGDDTDSGSSDMDAGPDLPPSCQPSPPPTGTVYYVDVDGDDGAGDGSGDAPWATITHALDNASDGSTILVRPGTYTGRIRMRGSFAQGVTVRSEVPYQARLRHDATVLTFYSHPNGCEGITLEGFDIAHSGPGSGALVVHIDGGGDNSVSRITLRDNVMHDSFDNDILKINNSTTGIIVERNMFYNQTGSDEHIDINSVEDVIVQDNLFFNDFEGSGRAYNAETSSYIVVKDSNGDSDLFTGSSNVHIRRNVFANWQGNTGTGFLLLGEDGKPFFESYDITVENNLFVGNSANDMRSPFGVKGGRDIVFRHNTITGDLPSAAYAMRLNTEGENPANENIAFYNNIWSDPTGTMGQPSSGGGELDFSDTAPAQITSFTLENNLYWNGGAPLPDTNDAINPSDDASGIEADPLLEDSAGFVLPRWDEGAGRFADGSESICEAHRNAAERYATPGASSMALGAADPTRVPEDDILGRPRGASPDVGALQLP
jgi:hypothetical protein